VDRINSVIVRLQNRRQEGQGMVEYALVIAVVGLAATVGMGALGTGLNDVFQNLGDAIGGITIPALP
jgi:pilus assembly protein Flp/PilA